MYNIIRKQFFGEKFYLLITSDIGEYPVNYGWDNPLEAWEVGQYMMGN